MIMNTSMIKIEVKNIILTLTYKYLFKINYMIIKCFENWLLNQYLIWYNIMIPIKHLVIV